jgi:hypothetical protein
MSQIKYANEPNQMDEHRIDFYPDYLAWSSRKVCDWILIAEYAA